MFRFTIRELVLVTLVVGLALGWLMDHRRQKTIADELWETVERSSSKVNRAYEIFGMLTEEDVAQIETLVAGASKLPILQIQRRRSGVAEAATGTVYGPLDGDGLLLNCRKRTAAGASLPAMNGSLKQWRPNGVRPPARLIHLMRGGAPNAVFHRLPRVSG